MKRAILVQALLAAVLMGCGGRDGDPPCEITCNLCEVPGRKVCRLTPGQTCLPGAGWVCQVEPRPPRDPCLEVTACWPRR